MRLSNHFSGLGDISFYFPLIGSEGGIPGMQGGFITWSPSMTQILSRSLLLHLRDLITYIRWELGGGSAQILPSGKGRRVWRCRHSFCPQASSAQAWNAGLLHIFLLKRTQSPLPWSCGHTHQQGNMGYVVQPGFQEKGENRVSNGDNQQSPLYV